LRRWWWSGIAGQTKTAGKINTGLLEHSFCH